MVKVTFLTEEEAWHGHSSESLWADALGGNTFRLANVPFFAKGVSFGDVVSAAPRPAGALEFGSVVSRGGHSTCRVVTKNPSLVDSLGTQLLVLKCEYERGDIGELTVLAVDIPPEAGVDPIIEFLELGRSRGDWDWEMGFDGHPEEDAPDV